MRTQSIYLAVVVALGLSIGPSAELKAMSGSVSLQGSQLAAASTALRDLLSGGRMLDLSKYSVHIDSVSDGYEIIFTPEQPPLPAGTIRRGVDTTFGPKVRYVISEGSNSILRRQFYR